MRAEDKIQEILAECSGAVEAHYAGAVSIEQVMEQVAKKALLFAALICPHTEVKILRFSTVDPVLGHCERCGFDLKSVETGKGKSVWMPVKI